MDEEEDDLLMNEDLIGEGNKNRQNPDDSDYSENDDDLDEEREIRRIAKEQAKLKKKQKLDKE